MVGISPRALAYVRKQATEIMQAQCRIERVNPPTFNQTTGTAVPGSRTTIYEGRCRIWEAAGASVTFVGEDDVSLQSTQLSIPWDVNVLPKKDDEVQMISHNTDALIVGKRFVIDSSAKAGELRATRRFSVRGYQER